MTDETITVYVTKYALTAGIQKVEGTIPSGYPGMFCKAAAYHQAFHGEGKEWHRTLAGAIERAEEMRQGKIMAIKKSLVKLEKLSFKDQVLS